MKKYSKCFERKTDINGNKFYCLGDEKHVALSGHIIFIHALLGEHANNDWIYEQIYWAFSDLEDEDKENRKKLIDQIQCDPFYYQLHDWLKNPFANELIKEAQTKIKISFPIDVNNLIGEGQKYAKRIIYKYVSDFLNNENSEN